MLLPLQLHLTLPPWVGEVADTGRRYLTDEERVGLAIELARQNVKRSHGGPFGAAVFHEDGRLVSAGINRVVPQTCSVAHAEMMAYMLAQQRLSSFRLNAGDNGRFIFDNGSPQGRDLRTTSLKTIEMMYMEGVFFLPPGFTPKKW